MIIIKNANELKSLIGKEIGVSDWLNIDQNRINAFADVTEDHQFIHVNPQMAQFSPFGTTIAHGFLTMSLATTLLEKIWKLEVRMGVNYGINKMRFPNAVKVNNNVRMRATLLQAEEIPQGYQLTLQATIEIENQEKPACAMEWLMRVYF
jgi:acyl dehydratase